MLVFMDESGDDGLKGRPNTSAHLVVAAILIAEDEHADQCERAIERVRSAERLPIKHEFRFSKSSNRVRTAFLTEMATQPFQFCSYVVDKTPGLLAACPDKHAFFCYAVQRVVESMLPHMTDALVVIDKTGPEEFHSEVCRFIRDRLSNGYAGRFKKVRMQHSHTSNLLQLADMVCGAVARARKIDKKDCNDYLPLVRHKAIEMIAWPEAQ